MTILTILYIDIFLKECYKFKDYSRLLYFLLYLTGNNYLFLIDIRSFKLFQEWVRQLYYPNDSRDERRALERIIKQGACVFFGIAVLGVIHAILLLTLGSITSFTIGLAATTVTAVFTEEKPTPITILTISLITLAAITVFSFIGVFAIKRRQWAFTIGMLAYSLDALLLILLQDWYGILFHLLVLFFIYRGYNAALQYHKL